MNTRKLLNLALAGSISLTSLLGFTASSSAASIGEEISTRAETLIGYNITDFDSADFVSYVFEKEGLEVPDRLRDLSLEGELILNKKDLQSGDVVFFGTSRNNLIAAGIYTGNGQFVVAYKPYKEIKRMNLNDDIPRKYFLGAKRITSTTDSVNQPNRDKSNKPAWEITADKVIAHGMHHLGTEYKLGADYDKDGSMLFDCSSFTQHMFEKGAKFDLTRTSRSQFLYDGNKQLTRKELRKGDLIFFTTIGNFKKYDEGYYKRNGHVGIVKEVKADGSIKILHTFKPGVGVVVETMRADKNDFWSKAFLYGKRVINDNGTEAKDVIMPKDGLTEGK